MKLTSNQFLIQEALLNRTTQTIQKLQQNPPEKQSNPMVSCTAAFAAVASDNDEAVNLFVSSLALLLSNSSILAKQVEELKATVTELQQQPQIEEVQHD